MKLLLCKPLNDDRAFDLGHFACEAAVKRNRRAGPVAHKTVARPMGYSTGSAVAVDGAERQDIKIDQIAQLIGERLVDLFDIQRRADDTSYLGDGPNLRGNLNFFRRAAGQVGVTGVESVLFLGKHQ